MLRSKSRCRTLGIDVGIITSFISAFGQKSIFSCHGLAGYERCTSEKQLLYTVSRQIIRTAQVDLCILGLNAEFMIIMFVIGSEGQRWDK